ncbi:MAG: radical SAM protein [Pirellulaceae bacterium]
MGIFRHADYVELTIHFRCNLKCEHCMIEDTMDRLEPASDDKLFELIEYNLQHRQWKGLILTGSEVTLRSDLARLATVARNNGFEHVRIQTHGMRLADSQYCQQLVNAGVDEFFVSVTAADEQTHDAITAVPGSFRKTMRGLENLDQLDGVSILTNTVMTQRCYQQLPELVDLLRHLRRLVQMDFWNYWPMSETDDKQLIVSHLDLLPYLRTAIHRAQDYGRAVEVKNFPECLLGADHLALDNTQPKLFIDPNFWPEFHRNGFHQCKFRDECASTNCLGLNSAYVQKFGWHESHLRPYDTDPRDVRVSENMHSASPHLVATRQTNSQSSQTF